MTTFRALIIITSAIVALGSLRDGNAASKNTPSGGLLLAMDDMKPMKPDAPGSGMNQGGQKMGGDGMMMDDGMEAVKSARTAFARLYPSLDDPQKQTADTILLPLIATF